MSLLFLIRTIVYVYGKSLEVLPRDDHYIKTVPLPQQAQVRGDEEDAFCG
jgi:hypothetical protein